MQSEDMPEEGREQLYQDGAQNPSEVEGVEPHNPGMELGQRPVNGTKSETTSSVTPHQTPQRTLMAMDKSGNGQSPKQKVDLEEAGSKSYMQKLIEVAGKVSQSLVKQPHIGPGPSDTIRDSSQVSAVGGSLASPIKEGHKIDNKKKLKNGSRWKKKAKNVEHLFPSVRTTPQKRGLDEENLENLVQKRGRRDIIESTINRVATGTAILNPLQSPMSHEVYEMKSEMVTESVEISAVAEILPCQKP